MQDKKKKWWVLVHSDTALRNGVIEVNINTQQPNNYARITAAIATQAAARLAPLLAPIAAKTLNQDQMKEYVLNVIMTSRDYLNI